MKIIAIERECREPRNKDYQTIARQEASRLYELYQQGVVREFYFRQDCNEAVLILECENISQAADFLATLPIVKTGYSVFDLVPLKAYPGFSRLFAQE